MNRRLKFFLLIGLIILLTLLIFRQSAIIYHNLHQVELPHNRSRQSSYLQTQKWMTVSEIAQKYNVSEKDVFEALQINPEQGDEKLSLRALRNKYNKSPSEMQSNLRQLLKITDPAGNDHE
ncbi:hypothetical protein L7E55_14405 [Pelotomaculum isophthalicicum JI]|uniref:Uncharacterized protein n=1 Tax=Pelotomaculum isophthalicicum JI TaxID=947010 RepID=A0A9X4JTY7_9FIRM|nr:hypothetical protein [Pelotomaculum isophthalicicum]MDF9409534.1 hypothetical protein [Pelotomaculum isophthalicicum JI]